MPTKESEGGLIFREQVSVRTLTGLQRPSAKTLLNHKFIRNAKKTAYLTELIERAQLYARAPEKPLASTDDLGYEEADRHATTRQDTWDFGTIRPQDRQAIIDRRNSSYDYSDSDDQDDDEEEGTGQYGTICSYSQPGTVRDLRKIDPNVAKRPTGSRPDTKHDEGDNSGTERFRPLTVDLPEWKNSLGTAQSRQVSRVVGEVTGPTRSAVAGQPENGTPGIQQSATFKQVILPSLAQLRAQAFGYPVALRSLDKLERCLAEIEGETTGIVDTFIVTIMGVATQVQQESGRQG